MTSAVIYSFCKPELVGFLSLMVVLETLIIIYLIITMVLKRNKNENKTWFDKK